MDRGALLLILKPPPLRLPVNRTPLAAALAGTGSCGRSKHGGQGRGEGMRIELAEEPVQSGLTGRPALGEAKGTEQLGRLSCAPFGER